jgi:hypothetical protein
MMNPKINEFQQEVMVIASTATASPLPLSDQIISQMITQGGSPVSIILALTVFSYFLLHGGKK